MIESLCISFPFNDPYNGIQNNPKTIVNSKTTIENKRNPSVENDSIQRKRKGKSKREKARAREKEQERKSKRVTDGGTDWCGFAGANDGDGGQNNGNRFRETRRIHNLSRRTFWRPLHHVSYIARWSRGAWKWDFGEEPLALFFARTSNSHDLHCCPSLALIGNLMFFLD